MLVADVDVDFAHRRNGDGVDLVGGFGAGGEDLDPVTGEVLKPACGHLGAPGVVDADEQHGRLSVIGSSSVHVSCAPVLGQDKGQVGVRVEAADEHVAERGAGDWIATNGGDRGGAMPANVLENIRAMVTAGLANLVELVNQYAAVM